MYQTEKEYGEFQDDTSWYSHAGQQEAGEIVYLALGLVGESGEFADAIKKIIRESGVTDARHFDKILERPGVKEKLIDELGDTFWYLNKLARFLELDMETLMVKNTYKLYSRLSARPKSQLMELEWPFTSPGLSYAAVASRHALLKDKDKDGV